MAKKANCLVTLMFKDLASNDVVVRELRRLLQQWQHNGRIEDVWLNKKTTV